MIFQQSLVHDDKAKLRVHSLQQPFSKVGQQITQISILR